MRTKQRRLLILALTSTFALGAAEQVAHAGLRSFVQKIKTRNAARRDYKAFLKGDADARSDYRDAVSDARFNHVGAPVGINFFLPLLWGPSAAIIHEDPKTAAIGLTISALFEVGLGSFYGTEYRKALKQGRARALEVAARQNHVPAADRYATWKAAGILPADAKK